MPTDNLPETNLSDTAPRAEITLEISPEIATEIATELATWHAAQQRDLPWRTAPPGKRDPYQVWISEIMAQQTRLETVVDYYQRWLERFPTLAQLAAADQQAVLKVWEGLGYYARARNLHRAAQIVVAEHGGEVPANRRALLALPGIGAYTVGAILSLAFNHPEPILDGNVKRVLSRITDLPDAIDQPSTVRHLWQLATVVVQAAPPDQAGAVNEALMELGATLCTPQNPRCLLCPVQRHCQAAARGTQDQRPVTTPRKATPHFDVAAGVIWQGAPFASRLLIAQRPQNGMLGGLWEFPGGKQEPTDADLPACLAREIHEELGIQIAVGAPITTVQHAYTHFRITLHAFHARHVAGAPQSIGVADWRWIELDALGEFPFPVTDQKVIRALHAARESGVK
ncbi:MAG: A/G-specific adenine glycosylase [Litorilinea sp.]